MTYEQEERAAIYEFDAGMTREQAEARAFGPVIAIPERSENIKALSIRQPWAWMILHGGKDIENRDWPTRFRGRVMIHASKSMTGDEYADAFDFAISSGALPNLQNLPQINFANIERGGIVGSVEIVDCVTRSDSKWFMGKYGFVLRNPIVLPFQPYRGALGFFDIPSDFVSMTPPQATKDAPLCGAPADLPAKAGASLTINTQQELF